MRAELMDDAATVAETPSRGLARLISTGRWIAYFAISFALTAGVLILAHV